ncbi:MAG: magnesium transporter CorA family protein [Patescibacteria group bacterium]|nr:magnesium transporter CorA family protein [Patescibacteria group bacterium]
MIQYLYRSIKDSKLKTLSGFRPGCWVHVQQPSSTELDILANQLKLNRNLLTDACDPFEVPRLEIENDVIYAFGRGATYENYNIITSPVLIVIGKDFVLTICNTKIEIIQTLTKPNSDIITTQKTRLFVKLYSVINESYYSIITDLNRQVRKISINPGKIKDEDIIKLVKFEEALNLFLADLKPTSQFLNQILSGKYLSLYENDKNLVEDILLSTEQLINQSEFNLKTITNIREAYFTIATNQLNRIIKIFTVFTVILTIPMIISGLYGMNIALPLQEHPQAFAIVVTATFGICLTLIIIFRKKDWF